MKNLGARLAALEQRRVERLDPSSVQISLVSGAVLLLAVPLCFWLGNRLVQAGDTATARIWVAAGTISAAAGWASLGRAFWERVVLRLRAQIEEARRPH